MFVSTLLKGRLFAAPTLSASAVLLRFNAPATASRLVTRSFITTAQLAEQAKKATSTTTNAEAKPASTQAKAKPKAKPKATKKTTKKAAPKKKAEPKKIVIKHEDLPPKRPPTPYFIFFNKVFKAREPIPRDQAGALAQARQIAIDAGAKWKALSDQEKQPFKDEYAELLKKWQEEYKEYTARVPYNVLRELNARRVAKGKKPVRRTIASTLGRPASPFIRFMEDFGPEYYSNYHGPKNEKVVNCAKAAATKWREMSEADKAGYWETYKKEVSAFQASKAESA